MSPAIHYLELLPVEWFVLIGSFVEGVISPLPMALVLVPAGAAVSAQHTSAWYILALALLAGLGRVAGALILYWLSSRLHEVAYSRRETWFGMSRPDVARLQRRLGQKKAWWTLFAMWAVPIFPGAPISLMCGFIKLPRPVFISATFAGSAVGSALYLYLGYLGLNAVAAWQEYELGASLLGGILAIIAIIWIVRLAKHK